MRTSLLLRARKAEELFRGRETSHNYWTRNRVYDVFYKAGFGLAMGLTAFGICGIIFKGANAVISHVGPEAEEQRKKMRAAEIAQKQEQALAYLQNQERFDNIKKPENPDA